MNNIQRFLRSFQTPYLQNKFLIESSRSLGSLPPNINYNGLLYTFVPEMQMFVNQYGHMISISQATAFAEMSEFEAVADIDDTATDPGVVRRIMAERSPILAFAWSWVSDNGSDSATVQNWINNATLFEYVSPLVFITRWQANDDWKNGINTADKNAAYARLKGLSAGKRAIEPYSFAYTYWNYLSEGITGVSGSSTMYNDDGTSGVCAGIYANMWAEKGLSLGKAAWQQILNEISATGGSIDWVMSDVEEGYSLFNNFAIRGITGLINAFASNPKFTQTWYGVTSINQQMIADGVTVGNVALGPPNTDYVVWNKAINSIVTVLLNEVLWEPTVAMFPNAQGSNYSNFISGSSTDAPRDLNGHPNYDMSIFGSAASPVLYGVVNQLATAWKINPSDTTQIIFGATTDPNYIVNRSPWNSFLLDIQNIRTLKRNSPNVPFTPWIASVKYAGVDQAGVSTSAPPPVGYADVVAGYNADIGQTFGAAGNSAYYYEMVRHAALYGTKVFGYYNADSVTTGLTQQAQLLNSTINDVNTRLGGYTIETADSSKVSWQTNYMTSGAPTTSGDYLWRTTIKPGTIFEYPDSALNPSKVLSGSCVGTWITTETNTPPVVQPQILKDIFYVIGPSSTDGSPAAHGNGTPYAKWYALNKDVVTTFQGIPYTGNADVSAATAVTAGRAYDFEFNPINPEVSSPWHNVMYENCIDAYRWGARSFYLSYPLGQIPQLAYPFKDVVNRRNGLYTSTTDAAYSPARWKGFTSAVKALLEGTLNPAGACAAKSGFGFTAMTEGCNVMMYFQGTNGYWENRWGNTGAGPDGLTFYPGSLKLWDDCFAIAGSTQGANDLYYSYIDQFVDEILSIASNLGTAGILTCAFDATVDSATPATLDLFSQLPSYYTRGNSYELGDWYIQERLRLGGVQCYTEARTETYKSPLNAGICGSGWDPPVTTDTSIIRFNNKNLLMYSENFAFPGSWSRSLNPRVSGPTYGPSPIGTTNANLITFGQNYSRVVQVPTSGQRSALSVGNTCTYSMWIKRVSGNTGLILYHFNGGANETPITVTNDWARYSTSFAPTNTAVEVGIADKNSSGFGSVLVWGAQLETGFTATSYQATTGKAEWKNWLAVEYNTWFQNPQNPVLGATQDGYYSGYLTDEDTPTAFRWTQNTGPIPSTKDPFRVPLTIGTGGVTYGLPFGFATWYYSPQKYLTDLYAASDVYRAFNNISNTGTTFAGVVYNRPTKGYILQYNDYARGSCGNLEVSATNNTQSLTGYYRLSTEVNQQGNAIGYASPFTKAFNQTSWISAGGTAYAANGNSGFWQLSAVTFWRENVKQPTFDGFLNMLRQVSLTGAPIYGNTSGWAGATYPYDFYSRGIMPLNYRN